jgi:hypothetical protein
MINLMSRRSLIWELARAGNRNPKKDYRVIAEVQVSGSHPLCRPI